MDPTDPVDVRYRALADPSRRKILEYLKRAGGPCDVVTLASALHLHPNTIRGHLELLEKAGLVTRSQRSTNRPGRPPLEFEACSFTGLTELEAYRRLAQILSNSLALTTEDPARAAEAAGEVWGRKQVDSSTNGDDPIGTLVSMLDSMGFEQELTEVNGRVNLDLVGCPFRDLAAENPEVICALHLGMMRGVGEKLGIEVEGLQPFLEPSLCRSVLATVDA